MKPFKYFSKILYPFIFKFHIFFLVIKIKNNTKKILVGIVLVLVIISGLSLALNSHAKSELIPISGATIVPTGVSNTLNITFSDVTYSTVPPAFEVSRGNYNVNATWVNPGATSVNVTNATYLVMQSTSSTATLAQVQYDLANYNKNASYFFMETKIAANLTGLTGISLVLSQSGVSSYLASAVNGTVVINIPSTGILSGTVKEAGTSTTLSSTGSVTISALQMYDLSVYVYKDTSTSDSITIGLINPVNGAVLGTLTSTGLTGLNFSKLNYTTFQFEGTTGSALILDWAYFVFSGSSSASVSPSVMPEIAGATSNVVMNDLSSIAPFDPSAVSNASYKQNPNATYVHTNTAVGDKDFNLSASVLSNDTASQLSIGAYNAKSEATFGVGNQTAANSTTMVANLTVNKENTNSFTADVHISTFNSTGIQTAVMSFLKNYTANLATSNTGIAYSYKNMTIISYMISNIQTVTNLSASDAAAVRNYFDNAFPSLLSENNLSLVDTNTSAIVAGAFAGDFYYQGMAYVPEIWGSTIVNPVNGQKFANLSDAGFAAGAYISGGAVIVPQLTILGWASGTPIFASGFSFGSLFSGLTSAGASVENYLGNGVSSVVHNTIGAVSHTVSNYVVKPITSATSSVSNAISKDINGFGRDELNVVSKVMPTLGTTANNVEKTVKGAIGPISGAVSDLSSSLASAKNGIVTAIAAGASGVRSNIYSLGTQIKSGVQGIENTLGNDVSTTDGVLSSMFTAVKSLPGKISSGLSSVASTLKNSTLSALDTVGNTIEKTASGAYKEVTNTFGSISSRITNTVGSLTSGLKNAFSAITAFGAKLGFVLEIVGITIVVVVIVGLVLYFGVLSRRKMIPGEGAI